SSGSLTSSVASGVYETAHTVALNGLAPATTYYYRVRSADAAGNATTFPAAPAAPLTFTTTAGPSSNCPCSIWAPSAVPSNPSVDDGSSVELGVKFRASVNGYIT